MVKFAALALMPFTIVSCDRSDPASETKFWAETIVPEDRLPNFGGGSYSTSAPVVFTVVARGNPPEIFLDDASRPFDLEEGIREMKLRLEHAAQPKKNDLAWVWIDRDVHIENWVRIINNLRKHQNLGGLFLRHSSIGGYGYVLGPYASRTDKESETYSIRVHSDGYDIDDPSSSSGTDISTVKAVADLTDTLLALTIEIEPNVSLQEVATFMHELQLNSIDGDEIVEFTITEHEIEQNKAE